MCFNVSTWEGRANFSVESDVHILTLKYRNCHRAADITGVPDIPLMWHFIILSLVLRENKNSRYLSIGT